jgi:hypothetical protein
MPCSGVGGGGAVSRWGGENGAGWRRWMSGEPKPTLRQLLPPESVAQHATEATRRLPAQSARHARLQQHASCAPSPHASA